MNQQQQRKEWNKRRKKIYKEWLKGKSQRQLGIEYGVSNERIRQIIVIEKTRLDKILDRCYT